MTIMILPQQQSRFRGIALLLLLGFSVFTCGATSETPDRVDLTGWFQNEGEVVATEPWGLPRVDMATAIVLDNSDFVSGRNRSMISTFVFAVRTDRVLVLFLSDDLELIARKEITSSNGLVSAELNRVCWQRRIAGSGQGGTGESRDKLAVTFNEDGDLALEITSIYSISQFFGLRKKQGEMHERFLFRRAGQIPEHVAKLDDLDQQD